jgi:hypothetical protein
LTGVWILPFSGLGGDTDTDLPVPFGPKTAWLAVETRDTEAVATALDLQEAQPATWAEGVEAAYQSSVFVTPPLADWTLAVGTALFPPDRAEAFVKPLLERLSLRFGEAQYFCTHRDFELHVWARARQGLLVRGYGWLGRNELTLWDEGKRTQEERDLGFRFLDRQSPAAMRPQDTNVTTEIRRVDDRILTDAAAGQAENTGATVPDEAGLMELASLWSIDPTTLDEHFKEPEMGLLGHIARARS